MGWLDSVKHWGGEALNWGSGVGELKAGANALGITSPAPQNLADPSNPAYQQLQQAANQFNQGYTNAGGVANGAAVGVMGAQGEQQKTIDQLRLAANGGAPSAAEQMMRSAADENARRQLAASAAYQGVNPGEALRAGLSGARDANIQSIAQIGAQRAAEEATAREQLAGATGANLNAANAAYGTATGALGNAAQAYLGSVQAPYNAQVANQQLQVQNNAANSAAMGGLISAGGKIGAAAASDPELKTDVHDGRHMSDEFLSSLAPKTYKYEDEDNPLYAPGQRLGVMADKLPRHDITVGPDGKRWISATAMSDILAGLGRLHERLTKVEGGGGLHEAAAAYG